MNLAVGYYNWDIFAKHQGFYPDDMPTEWRLAYYANEIECVQLLLNRYSDEALWDELFDDLNPEFHLLVSFDEHAQWPLLQSILQQQGVSVVVVCSEALQQEYAEQIAAYQVVCVSLAQQQAVSFVPEMNGLQIVTDSIDVLYIRNPLPLKQWSKVIEQWQQTSAIESRYILLNSEQFNLAAASELRQVIEMMGY